MTSMLLVEAPRTVRFGASGERLADQQQVTLYRKSFYSDQAKVEIASVFAKQGSRGTREWLNPSPSSAVGQFTAQALMLIRAKKP
ncbi:hypothetical protein [Agrobacterium fabrum]|uniref:hypothetical protein n=1 Tax=Agrobacterium fabrum TaxID=1176649 RepID=UPI0021584762|nr:hypothetical protein [Agrobacterium fabrum]MCR6727639.1 hypothetical protein [Agrobacterium fabrum]